MTTIFLGSEQGKEGFPRLSLPPSGGLPRRPSTILVGTDQVVSRLLLPVDSVGLGHVVSTLSLYELTSPDHGTVAGTEVGQT